MKKVKYIIIALLPNILIILYVISLESAEQFSRVYFSIKYEMLVQILGNIIIGIYLFFVSMDIIKSKTVDYPSKYLLGVLLMPFIALFSRITTLYMPVILAYAFVSIPYYTIFSSFYIGAYIYSVRLKRKIRKQE